MPRQRRSFPPDFKAQVVLKLLTGGASQAGLCRKHNFKPHLLAYWKSAVLQPGTPSFRTIPNSSTSSNASPNWSSSSAARPTNWKS
jgi:transposase-like protein